MPYRPHPARRYRRAARCVARPTLPTMTPSFRRRAWCIPRRLRNRGPSSAVGCRAADRRAAGCQPDHRRPALVFGGSPFGGAVALPAPTFAPPTETVAPTITYPEPTFANARRNRDGGSALPAAAADLCLRPELDCLVYCNDPANIADEAAEDFVTEQGADFNYWISCVSEVFQPAGLYGRSVAGSPAVSTPGREGGTCRESIRDRFASLTRSRGMVTLRQSQCSSGQGR